MAEPPAIDSPSWARRLYRWAYWLPRDWLTYRRYGRPEHLIYFGGTGFGDDLSFLLMEAGVQHRERHFPLLQQLLKLVYMSSKLFVLKAHCQQTLFKDKSWQL